MRRNHSRSALVVAGAAPFILFASLACSVTPANADPVTGSGYSVKLLAAAPSGATGADSITIAGSDIFVGFGNHADPTGLNAVSTIAKYSLSGQYLGDISLAGHNDGLRYNASTGQIWALQNEDANPNLVLINPDTLAKSSAYAIPNPHGGGYDDVAFVNGRAFLSASNPANNPNSEPALISAAIPASGHTLSITPVLSGTASALDVNTGKTTALNLQDPDGIIKTPGNGVLFTSQGDQQVITVGNPGTAAQTAAVLNLNQQIDDTAFAQKAADTLLYTDTVTNNVYEVTGPFADGAAYTAGNGADGIAGGAGNISALNLGNGVFTPIVSNISPGGLAFLSGATNVPEPGSLALLATGLLGLAALKRRAVGSR